MDREEYEAEKARLKEVRRVTGDALSALRKEPWPPDTEQKQRYSRAVLAYIAAQDAVKAWIHTHGMPSGIPSRAERRKAKLRARGIKPVWD